MLNNEPGQFSFRFRSLVDWAKASNSIDVEKMYPKKLTWLKVPNRNEASIRKKRCTWFVEDLMPFPKKTAKKIDEGVQVGSVACWQHGAPSCTMTSGDRSTCSTSPREIVPASIWLHFHLKQIWPWNGIEMGHIALNCKCRGGCASFVQSGLSHSISNLLAKPLWPNRVGEIAPGHDFSNKTMPFAILKSKQRGLAIPKGRAFQESVVPPISWLIEAQWGISTHPWLIREVIGKLRFASVWPSYSFDTSKFIWSDERAMHSNRLDNAHSQMFVKDRNLST